MNGEASVNDNNDIEFSISSDGIKSDLSGASGMKQHTSSIGNKNCIKQCFHNPKPNFVTMKSRTINERTMTVTASRIIDRIKVKYLILQDFIIMIKSLTTRYHSYKKRMVCLMVFK